MVISFIRHESGIMHHLHPSLYPIFLRKSFRFALSSVVSTPFGEDPSITPIIPLPCLEDATTTSSGFAVVQKMRQTSGQFLIGFRTLMEKRF